MENQCWASWCGSIWHKSNADQHKSHDIWQTVLPGDALPVSAFLAMPMPKMKQTNQQTNKIANTTQKDIQIQKLVIWRRPTQHGQNVAVFFYKRLCSYKEKKEDEHCRLTKTQSHCCIVLPQTQRHLESFPSQTTNNFSSLLKLSTPTTNFIICVRLVYKMKRWTIPGTRLLIYVCKQGGKESHLTCSRIIKKIISKT